MTVQQRNWSASLRNPLLQFRTLDLGSLQDGDAVGVLRQGQLEEPRGYRKLIRAKVEGWLDSREKRAA